MTLESAATVWQLRAKAPMAWGRGGVLLVVAEVNRDKLGIIQVARCSTDAGDGCEAELGLVVADRRGEVAGRYGGRRKMVGQ